MTDKNIKIIIEQAMTGLTDEQIAKMIGYSAKAVRYWRKKAGIIKGPRGRIERKDQ